MNDRSSQTTGSGQRSAIGQGDVNFGFTKDRLPQVVSDQSLTDFVLIGPGGRVWTSAQNQQQAYKLVEQTMKQLQPEHAG